ncbi:hypothetical protein E4P41_06745 [Geodermatophilus sp. DF01-2]|uniref:right-handed parallel beta-helix repeat-containing protein n=1 Tax=Geodermatophilus sp. DF01-2 TaxID=2559610 RepID=UPI0010746736|nr:right-handed parallel beta-helix repeat-containing protein [Geodermatophilus sp. DF01_2]TFV62610.1 hypothetical protein E4P41_06745 [Geodermatophilus sp. DF01_2]
MRIHKTRLLAVASVAAVTTLSLAGPAAAGDGDRYRGGDDRSHSRDDDHDRDDHDWDDDRDEHGDRDGDEIEVRPGESIQEAVDAAEPGDTVVLHPGEYQQNVTITTDHLSLVGHDAVLLPAGAGQTECDTLGEGEAEEGGTGGEGTGGEGTGGEGTGGEGTGGEGTGGEEPAPPAEEPRMSGICILGDVVLPPPPTNPEEPPGEIEVRDAVTGVSIRGITVKGASGDGLIAVGTENLKVRDSRFADNGGYGAASFVGTGTTFRDDEATGNAEAGFYVGDSPDSQADVRDNHAVGNELGFFFRSASNGKARDNVAEHNCLGMLVLADAPGPAAGWDLRDNRVKENNAECQGPEPGTTISGAGIVMFGATEFRVRDNKVTGHVSQSPETTVAAGGIVVLSGFGGTAPSGEVEDNKAKGNEPADIVWDETGEVEFDDNRCEESIPDGLCD